jgi:hypothetical protein
MFSLNARTWSQLINARYHGARAFISGARTSDEVEDVRWVYESGCWLSLR